MMTSLAVDVTTFPRQLRDLVEEAARAGEVVLTRGGEAVAKIVPVSAKRPRKPGSARGQIHMADDFDETPEDFRDYV
jgi:antitoxin (DNA-binding transcriptional repressor) of toxin-antitoxin stability system